MTRSSPTHSLRPVITTDVDELKRVMSANRRAYGRGTTVRSNVKAFEPVSER